MTIKQIQSILESIGATQKDGAYDCSERPLVLTVAIGASQSRIAEITTIHFDNDLLRAVSSTGEHWTAAENVHAISVSKKGKRALGLIG